MLGRLDDPVLFGVQTAADLVPFARWDAQFFAKAPDLGAVTDAGRHTIVPGGQDILVLDENRSHLTAQACGTGGDQPADLHEILIPQGTDQRLAHSLSALEPVAVEGELLAKFPDLALDSG